MNMDLWDQYPPVRRIALIESSFTADFLKMYDAHIKPTVEAADRPEGEAMTDGDVMRGIEEYVQYIRNILVNHWDLFKC